jgi:hypothetical protein
VENKKLLPISIIILSVSLAFSSIWLGYSLKKPAILKNTVSLDRKVLTLSQAAEYLNMTDAEVLGIIKIEKMSLDAAHSFSGKMFPYFSVDNKQYFDKNEIDEWAKEASISQREYNTKEGWIKK